MKPTTAMLLLALILPLQACSWIMVDKAPPEKHWDENVWKDREMVQCSDSNLWPILDAIFAASSTASVLANVGNEGAEAALFSSMLSVGVYGASSYYGFTETGRCATFKRKVGFSSNSAWEQSPVMPDPLPPLGSFTPEESTK